MDGDAGRALFGRARQRAGAAAPDIRCRDTCRSLMEPVSYVSESVYFADGAVCSGERIQHGPLRLTPTPLN